MRNSSFDYIFQPLVLGNFYDQEKKNTRKINGTSFGFTSSLLPGNTVL